MCCWSTSLTLTKDPIHYCNHHDSRRMTILLWYRSFSWTCNLANDGNLPKSSDGDKCEEMPLFSACFADYQKIFLSSVNEQNIRKKNIMKPFTFNVYYALLLSVTDKNHLSMSMCNAGTWKNICIWAINWTHIELYLFLDKILPSIEHYGWMGKSRKST